MQPIVVTGKMPDDYFAGREGVLSPADATAALIVLPRQRYLMQMRDQKAGIFYPGHWGAFGGAIDGDEGATTGLYRELDEELSLFGVTFKPFTEITIDFSYCGLGKVARHYYCGEIEDSKISELRLGEGREMRVFSAFELLTMPRVVPYDALAIWMHSTRDKIKFRSGR